jgi:hypothetical protein
VLDLDGRSGTHHLIGWNFCRSFIVLLSNRSGGILTMGTP